MKQDPNDQPQQLDPYRGGMTAEEVFLRVGYTMDQMRELSEATGIPISIDDVPDSDEDDDEDDE